MMEQIGQVLYASTLDMTKGDWQIPVAHKDQKNSALGMPWGLYEFKRMLFSLHGAVATLQ